MGAYESVPPLSQNFVAAPLFLARMNNYLSVNGMNT